MRFLAPLLALAAAVVGCGGVHASRGTPPPIPPVLPALKEEEARPIRVPPLRCETFVGRSTGELDRALSAHAGAFAACYRASVAAGAPVRGTIAVDVAIADDGEVLGATVRDTDVALDRVGACVTDSFRGVRLPAPEAGCLRVAWVVPLGGEASPSKPASPSPGAVTW